MWCFCVVPPAPPEPHFLHAIDYGNYVYFFLSEIAVEYTTLGKVCVCVCVCFKSLLIFEFLILFCQT